MRTIIDVYQIERPTFGRPDIEEQRDIQNRLEKLMGPKGFKSKLEGFKAETGFILNEVYLSPDGSVVITNNENIMGNKVIEGTHIVTTSSDSRLASTISREIKNIYLDAGYNFQMHEDSRA